MAPKEAAIDFKGRLEDYIDLARSGKSIRLQVHLYRKWFRQVSRSNATDDLDVATDQCLHMVDFSPVRPEPGMPVKVTKAYMISPINEIEADDKTTRHIANERLRMDYARLKEADIHVQEEFF
jgi:hypothetical protein